MIIKTEYGEGELIDVHVSELGYTMIKLYFAESKKYITFIWVRLLIDQNTLQI